jgi:hypothetical protein
MLRHVMSEFLQQLDPDYYRRALLLIVRTELKRLHHRPSAPADGNTQSKFTPSAPRSSENGTQALASTETDQSHATEVDLTG